MRMERCAPSVSEGLANGNIDQSSHGYFFGARVLEFWYAIRARAYVRRLGKEADLKMTIVTRYDARSQSTLVLLKYRSFNDLPQRLHEELVDNLQAFVREPTTAALVKNPFITSVMHFNPTIQYFRRAAREPRDTIRDEEARVHGGMDEFARIDLHKLHLTLTSLDQDKIQMSFILGVIARLRIQHETFQTLVEGKAGVPERDWLYFRMEEEFDRFENQIAYFKSSVEDVARRVERLLELVRSPCSIARYLLFLVSCNDLH